MSFGYMYRVGSSTVTLGGFAAGRWSSGGRCRARRASSRGFVFSRWRLRFRGAAMGLTTSELQLFTLLFVGFVAFSVPLLLHDLRRGISSVSSGAAPEELPPAPPPPYYNGFNEDDDQSKFRHAVADGNIETAERLLNASLAQDEPVDFVTTPHWHGSTALFEAARSGHLEMAKWLVSRGADPDHSNEWGDSPANEAASMGHWDLVWYLADAGADLTRQPEHAHSTLVLSAVRHRSVAALAELKRRGVNLSQRQWNGATALHEAARTGEVELLNWLVTASQIDINAVNDQGENALHEAALMGHGEAVKRLLEAGCSIGEKGSAPATSIMFSAIRHSNMELLEHMSGKGVLDANAEDRGRHPLTEAVQTGNVQIAEWLIAHDCNVTAESATGETAVAAAAMEDKFPIVWLLSKHGASLHVTNEYGGSVLMSAVGSVSACPR